MAVNRKSVVQILVLVLLVVVGAGGYLYTQEGGIGFITDFFGGGTPPPQTIPVRAPAAKAPASPAAKKDEGPVIPAQPVTGRLRNAAFTPELAEIDSGVLTLRQGKGALDTEVTIYLYTKPWEVPAGRSFKLMSPAAAPDAPHVRIRWHDDGQNAPRQREYAEKYTLVLEFGQEKDKKLPGKLFLSLPDEDKSQLAGTFEAEIRGFRLINGKPDLSSDSVDTLQFLALSELLKDDVNKSVKDISFQQGRFDAVAPPGFAQTGYLEVTFRIGDGAPARQKFQYVKENDAWRVVGTLRPGQLEAAHPYKAPGPKDPPDRLFPYLAAKRVETEVQKRYPDKLINSVEFITRTNEAHKIGTCEAAYKIEDGQPVQTAFLFRRGPNGWKLERELGKKERVNFALGKVEMQR